MFGFSGCVDSEPVALSGAVANIDWKERLRKKKICDCDCHLPYETITSLPKEMTGQEPIYFILNMVCTTCLCNCPLFRNVTNTLQYTKFQGGYFRYIHSEDDYLAAVVAGDFDDISSYTNPRKHININ